MKQTAFTAPAWALSASFSSPVLGFHSRSSPGKFNGAPADAVASRVPSTLNANPATGCAWPLRVAVSAPVAVSHSFTVPFESPVAMRQPSGLNVTNVA